MDTHRKSKILLCAGCLVLALTACSKQNSDQTKLNEREKSYAVSADNVIARASQSRSIVFPLSVEISESLPNFTKVEVKGSKEIDPEALAFSVYSCSFYEIIWFDSSSHWKAIVTPSDTSDLFRGDTGHHFSDKEMIDCVRNNYGHSFFYRVSSRGYRTGERDPT
jgi:hypothetical protein